jgi:hypothetical protein
MNKNNFLVLALLFATTFSVHAQNNAVKLVRDKTNPAVHVTINGKHSRILLPSQCCIPSRHRMELLSPEGFP